MTPELHFLGKCWDENPSPAISNAKRVFFFVETDCRNGDGSYLQIISWKMKLRAISNMVVPSHPVPSHPIYGMVVPQLFVRHLKTTLFSTIFSMIFTQKYYIHVLPPTPSTDTQRKNNIGTCTLCPSDLALTPYCFCIPYIFNVILFYHFIIFMFHVSSEQKTHKPEVNSNNVQKK